MSNLLPSTYKELEYIQSSGSQYIDTGVHITTNYVKVKAKIIPLDWNGGNPNKRGWGVQGTSDNCFTSWDNSVGGVGSTHPDGWLALGNSWYFNKTSSTFFNTTLGQPYEMDFTANNGTAVGSYAGESFNASYGGTLINSSRSIYLFDCNAHYAHTPTSSKIYYFEIETAEGSRNLIPAERVSDNEIGMYDTVSSTFFTNAGTGDFIAGPYVQNEYNCYKRMISYDGSRLPIGYTEVEYIEEVGTGSSGANIYKIDTGIAGSLDTEIETEINHIGNGDLFTYIFTPFASNCSSEGGIILSHYSSGPSWASKFGNVGFANKGNIALNTWQSVVMNKDNFMIDGTSKGTIGATSLSDTSNIFIMCDIWSSNIQATTKLQMKNFIIRKSGTVVFNGIACKNNATDKYGFYDTISNTFKGNSGTGTFTAGPAVAGIVTSNCYLSKIMAGSSRLPSGYTELEYIQSSGSQYIDTGYLPSLGTRFIVDAEFTSVSRGRFGSYGNHSDGIRFYFGVVSSKWAVGYGSDSEFNHNVGDADTNRHTFELNDTNFNIDGSSALSYTRHWHSIMGNIFLFARSDGQSITDNASAKVYSSKIYSGTTLVRNFIPAKYNNVVGMYDLVTNQFYTNQGSGTFTPGPEVQIIVTYNIYKRVINA